MVRLTTGALSARSGVPVKALRKVIDRYFPEFVERAGLYRTVPGSIAPDIVAKCRELGYLGEPSPTSKQPA